uniref:Uncharacterized protein n=1 Tax=Rhizophora mucronata TaxID=61149 RepID=A0A2P2NI83_RHIMU
MVELVKEVEETNDDLTYADDDDTFIEYIDELAVHTLVEYFNL